MRSSHWFFTWRTYGTWLPGAEGFVGRYHTTDGRRTIDHTHGSPATDAIPALERYSRGQLKSEPVALTQRQADAVVAQLHETAHFRKHTVEAVAVLATHVHLVFVAVGEPDPDRCLADWKAYASRALNRLAGAGTRSVSDGVKSQPARWWAECGSKRRLLDEDARPRSICYVRDQMNPLVVWLSEESHLLVVAQEPGA